MPHFQYCSTVLNFCRARNCEKLESLNKRALRIVLNDKVSSYQQLLHNSGGATLYNWRIQNMLITIYKCLNYESFPKYLCVSLYPLLQELILYHHVNLLLLLNHFRYFASKKWNSLLNNVRSEPTLSGFKRLRKAISFQT